MKSKVIVSFIVASITLVHCSATLDDKKQTCQIKDKGKLQDQSFRYRFHILYLNQSCVGVIKDLEISGLFPFVKMDVAESCPPGTEIKTEKECSEVLNFASDLGITIETSSKMVKVGSWGFLPYQCSYRAGGDQTFFFNSRKADSPKLFLSGMHRMICKNGNIFVM